MKILNEEINNGDIVVLKVELGGIDQEYLGIINTKIAGFNKLLENDFRLTIYNGSEDIEYFKIKNIKDIKIIKKGENKGEKINNFID